MTEARNDGRVTPAHSEGWHWQPSFVSETPPVLPALRRSMTTTSPIASFWMGGYEGADHVNGHGTPLDVCEITQHASQAMADYLRLAQFDVRTVRESAGWRLIESGGHYDFSSLNNRATAAQALGLQVVWTLCHYGWPRDLDILSSSFVDRFARYARAVAAFLSDFSVGTPIYTPINEISFLAWAVCETGRMQTPVGRDRAPEVKRQLVRAALAACAAIRDVDPRARFLHTDPLMHVVPPPGRRDLNGAAMAQCERQFEAWDMLCGRRERQLGGDPRYLDMIGVNYYAGNQWELSTGKALSWQLDDPRQLALSLLLDNVYRRYARAVVIAETGHSGVRRGDWLREVTVEAERARERGVRLEGICLYPLIDRPDWDNSSHWHDCGLWDIELAADGMVRRCLNGPYAQALREAQRRLPMVAPLRAKPRAPVYPAALMPAPTLRPFPVQ